MTDFRDLFEEPAPSEVEISRFFALEREIDTLPMSPEQRVQKNDILGNITQYISSRTMFLKFLTALDKLMAEIKASNDAAGNQPAAEKKREGNEKFNAYFSQFNEAEDERMRTMIADELKSLGTDDLVLLYTMTLGVKAAYHNQRKS